MKRHKTILLAVSVIIFFLTLLILYINQSDRFNNVSVLTSPELRHQDIPIDWDTVNPEWKGVAEQHLEKMREIESKNPIASRPDYIFDREFFEIKSPYILKYLSNYHIYTTKYSAFAVRKDGVITQIASPALDWSAKGGEQYYTSPKYSQFISEQQIQVENEETAIGIVKLSEDIYRFAYKLSDGWKHRATKKDNVWEVHIDFIGPSDVSIVLAPVWEIVTDEQNNVLEIRHQLGKLW